MGRIAETKQCKNCSQKFEIKDKDLKFYKRIQVSPPTLCPECRLQRRLTYRCERALYKRKCGICKKDMISIHHEDMPFPVYCNECWWSDKWDPLEYAQDFDFGPKVSPFFEQFAELQSKVPRITIFTNKSQNCDYTCHSFHNKNCYLSFGIKDCEECYYASKGVSSKNCIDCYIFGENELCYECIDCVKCYNSKFLANCTNCTDCDFGYDLIGCQNCFGCAGLRRKSFHIFNKPKTKEEYFEEMKKINLCDKQQFKEITTKFKEIKLKTPHKYLNILNSENCTGDYLRDSKNSIECFESDNSEDCGYLVFTFRDKDCYDLYGVGDSELSYECMGVEEVYNLKFSYVTDNTKDSSYCSLCFSCNDLFGCVGLRKKKYCILNKQYSEEEYKTLISKIAEHMKGTGELGEYFPITISPYAYNETVAQEYFPLTKKQVLAKGYRWRDRDEKEYKPQTYKVPTDIKDVPDSIIDETLACLNCGKNFKIPPTELKFYRKMSLPIPDKCPDCRHKDRLAQKNPRKLYRRACQKCDTEIQTTYSPDRPEIIYCEKCYLEAIA